MLNCAAGHAELPDGRLFAVYYWADGVPVSCPSVHRSQPDKGHSCYERGTFFTPEDFGWGFLVDSEWQVHWPAVEVRREREVAQADWESEPPSWIAGL